MCMRDYRYLSIFHMVIILYSENYRDEFKKKNQKNQWHYEGVC